MWYAECETLTKSSGTAAKIFGSIDRLSASVRPPVDELGAGEADPHRDAAGRSRRAPPSAPRSGSAGGCPRSRRRRRCARSTSGERNCCSRWPWPRCTSKPSMPASRMFFAVTTCASITACHVVLVHRVRRRAGRRPAHRRGPEGRGALEVALDLPAEVDHLAEELGALGVHRLGAAPRTPGSSAGRSPPRPAAGRGSRAPRGSTRR